MEKTNKVYRYAIRKLKVGTASVAVAALMFLGSGNALVNAADSAAIANADSTALTQVEALDAEPTVPLEEAKTTPVTDSLDTTSPQELHPPVEVETRKSPEEVAYDLTQVEAETAVDSPTEAVAGAPVESTEGSQPVEEADAEVTASDLEEAETLVADQVKTANANIADPVRPEEEVKPLAYSNSAPDNQIVLPPGFSAELFREGAHTAAEIDAIAKPGREMNTYKSNEADKNEVVDVTNLTEAQRTELSLFIAGLINPIRERYGMQPFKVNADSVAAANKVAAAYQEDNWYPWTQSHDVNGTTRALANIANGWGENIATISPNTTTMDSLKQQFHYQTVWMLFDDSHANFGHTRNFLLFENPYGNHDVYIGVSTNRAGAADSSLFGTQYYTIFAPKEGATEFTPGNDYPIPGTTTTPSQPDQPVTPSQPDQPVTPSQPDQPVTPSQPDQPVTPSQPDQPVTPSQPDQPVTPSQPDQPVTPSQPDQPVTPSQPDQPVTPSQPDQPVTPSQPDQPVTPSQPDQPVTPSQPNQEPSQPLDPANDGNQTGRQALVANNTMENNQSSTGTQAPKANSGQQSEGKTLPDTGESSSVWLIPAAILSILSGIALLVRRKQV